MADSLKFLSLRVPRESDNTPEQTAQLLASLARATSKGHLFKKGDSLSLEVTVIDGQISFVIVYPEGLKSFIYSQTQATYQDAIMTEIEDYLPAWGSKPPVGLSLIRQAHAAYFPLRDYADYKVVDPMLPLLGVLSKAPEDDRLLLQFVLSPAPKSVASRAYTYLHPTPKEDEKRPLTPEGKKLIEDKLSHPLTSVSIRFASTNQYFTRDLAGAISVLNRPDGNSLVKAPVPSWDRAPLWQAVLKRRPFRSFLATPAVLNVMELSSLWHLPGVYTKLPNVGWAPSASITEPPETLPVSQKAAKPGQEVPHQDINFFASTTFRNQVVNFGIKNEDRFRHMYILGKSGTGKSTLLENMAVDDFKKGRGVAFIDPHGDSAEVLLNYIPSNRVNDTIYFDPADKDHPISLNILEVESPDQAELVASSIVAIFHKLYGHSWGPRLEYILRNTLLTLTYVPGSTLADVTKMLTQADFRAKVYPKLENPQILSFWKDEFDKLEDKTRQEHISPILNKVGQFVNSPLIHSIISHPKSSVKLQNVLNSGKIFIANLSQGKLGEDNSALLGAMLVTQIELAAMSRVNVEKADRKDFFLYVDEFQNFATESFIKILSEARKYRLGLTLANQYIAQIPESIQKAIFGNAGSVICFVLGADDAKVMTSEFGEIFDANSLVNLQRHQIALKMTIDNQVSPPFTALTLPPLKSTNSNKEKVIKSSQQRFSIKK